MGSGSPRRSLRVSRFQVEFPISWEFLCWSKKTWKFQTPKNPQFLFKDGNGEKQLFSHVKMWSHPTETARYQVHPRKLTVRRAPKKGLPFQWREYTGLQTIGIFRVGHVSFQGTKLGWRIPILNHFTGEASSVEAYRPCIDENQTEGFSNQHEVFPAAIFDWAFFSAFQGWIHEISILKNII